MVSCNINIQKWRSERAWHHEHDRMGEMLEAIWLELELGSEDPPTSNVQKIFDL